MGPSADRGVRAGICLAVAVGFLGYASLSFGVRWLYETTLDGPLVLAASALPLVLAAATGRRDLQIPTALLPVGVLAFVTGLYWEGAVCLQPGHGDAATWGLRYDWVENAVRFGFHGPELDYPCRAVPNRPVVLVGYLLATTGVVRTLEATVESRDAVTAGPGDDGRSTGADRRSDAGRSSDDRRSGHAPVSRGTDGRPRSIWSVSNREAIRRGLRFARSRFDGIGVHAAVTATGLAGVLVGVYLLGHGTPWGAARSLVAVSLAVLVLWGVAALVAGRFRSVGGAALAAIGVGLLYEFVASPCTSAAPAVLRRPTGVSLRPGGLAVRYGWTATVRNDLYYCHTDFFLPTVAVGLGVVAAGAALAVDELDGPERTT